MQIEYFLFCNERIHFILALLHQICSMEMNRLDTDEFKIQDIIVDSH